MSRSPPTVPAATSFRWRSAWVWAPPAIAAVLALVVWAFDLDLSLFRFFNGLWEVTGDGFWANVTILGASEVAVALAAPFLIGRPRLLWAIVVGALLCLTLTTPPKHIFRVHRPPKVLKATELPAHVIGPKRRQMSFPSGHTATAFLAAGILCLGRPMRRGRLLLLALVSLVGVSRVVAGIHWPLDVLGGAFAGWLSAALAVALAQRWPWGAQPVPYRVFACLILGAALLTLFGTERYEDAVVLRRVLGVIGTVAGVVMVVRAMRSGEGGEVAEGVG